MLLFNQFLRVNSLTKILVRKYTPRRALLYVPGNDLRKIDKAFGLEVDCIALDCEDGVALNQKVEAHKVISEVLENRIPINPKYCDLGVRVNSVETEFCMEDLKVILNSKNLPNTILLPKVETTEHLNWFAAALAKVRKDVALNLIIYIESAKGFLNLKAICESAIKLSEKGKLMLSTIVFGSDDFCASIGAVRSEDSLEIMYARQKLVLVAKAFNLQAIDMVYIKYKDVEGLKAQCIQGMKMGYTGKQVIHPGQIQVVQETFLPTKAQIDWAEELLESFVEHQKIGKGVFTFHGCMIDMPTVKQAKNILRLVEFKK